MVLDFELPSSLIVHYTLQPLSSWTANSDKKYMELNGVALNVNKPCVTSRKTALKVHQIFLQKSSHFPVKTVKFVCLKGRFPLKNRKIFLKKLKTFPAILQFFKENMPIFT